jgi:hypothetical protein
LAKLRYYPSYSFFLVFIWSSAKDSDRFSMVEFSFLDAWEQKVEKKLSN